MAPSAMKRTAWIAAPLAVAGCVMGAPSTRYYVDDPYQFFSYAASRGVIPVIAVGEPYGGRRAEVESAIVGALDRNFPSLGNPFRAAPPTPGEGTKVVVVFNASPTSHAVCSDPTRYAGPAATGPTTTAYAVYCGVGPYSDYWLTFPTPASPADPQFHAHMRRLTYFAIPREQDPSRRNGDFDPVN
jgi:hypothetical protein